MCHSRRWLQPCSNMDTEAQRGLRKSCRRVAGGQGSVPDSEESRLPTTAPQKAA